jgi:hypothetical protein
MAYNRSGYRRGATRTGGASRWMNLRYAGTCKVCGQGVAAGENAFYDAAARTVTCQRIECADADGLTTNQALTGPWDKRSDTRVLAPSRVGQAAPVHHAAVKVHTVRFNSGAVMSVNARGRCEDAPCCGCCS